MLSRLSFLENIKFKLKQRDIAIIVTILCIALAAAWWQFVRTPSMQRIATLNTEIEKVEKDIGIAKRAQRELPTLREEISELEQERIAFLRELPTENEVAQLVGRLRSAAADADVLLTQVSSGRGSNESVQGVRPLGFTVSTLGKYPNTLFFLRQLESFQRFTKISQVGFSVDEQGTANPNLSTAYDFVVYAFVGNDPGAGESR